MEGLGRKKQTIKLLEGFLKTCVANDFLSWVIGEQSPDIQNPPVIPGEDRCHFGSSREMWMGVQTHTSPGMTGCLGNTVDGRYPKQPEMVLKPMVKHVHGISTTYFPQLVSSPRISTVAINGHCHWWSRQGAICKLAGMLFQDVGSDRNSKTACLGRFPTGGNNPVGVRVGLENPWNFGNNKRKSPWKNASCFIEIHQKKHWVFHGKNGCKPAKVGP